MSQLFLINIYGPHDSEHLYNLCQSLSQYPLNVLDISQAVIYQNLNLAILIEIPSHLEISTVFKEILYTAHILGLTIQFAPVSKEQYQEWLLAYRNKRYILTLLGRNLTANHIFNITNLLRENQLVVYHINRLSARKDKEILTNKESLVCFEFIIEGYPKDISKMRTQSLYLSQEHGIDIGLQEDTPYRRHRRLIAFDMDSTLIQTEVIDELAKEAGVTDQVSKITESAMKGELDFKESLQKRVSLLQGLKEEKLQKVANSMPLTEGAERLIANLKIMGYKIAILSGGFTYFGRQMQSKMGIDYLFANELEIREGQLTGKIKGQIIDGPKKAELLNYLAQKENISLEQVIAVGDGANDLPMLNLAGLGIAFRAKPIVREGAEQAISNVGLDAILYFLGLQDREALI